MDASDFLFTIADTDDGSAVFITSKDTWGSEGSMDQGFDDGALEILEPILMKAGLAELMDSCYEMSKPDDETRNILLEEGLVEDSNFDKLIMTLY